LARLASSISFRKAYEVVEGVVAILTIFNLANWSHFRCVTECHCILNRTDATIAARTAMFQGSVLPRPVHEILIDITIAVVIEVVADVLLGDTCITDPAVGTRTRLKTATCPIHVVDRARLSLRQTIIYKTIAVIIHPVTDLRDRRLGRTSGPAYFGNTFLVPKANT